MDQKMEQVDIFLYLHPKRIGKIKEGTYKYTLSCRGQQITGEEKTGETTEYRLALLCLISALQRMRRPSLLTIHTDCRYLQNGHQSIPAWKENGWIPGRKPGTAQCRPLETGGQAVYGTCSAFQNRKNGLNTKGEHDVREIWRNEFIHRDQ